MPGVYTRYVALGDSTTEGIDDPDGAGGYRGWANRLAERLARTEPRLLYANLAVRGRLAGEVREEQLSRALTLRPDLATVVAGLNDMLRPGYRREETVDQLRTMVTALRGQGATVVTFTFPDPGSVAPIARALRSRFAGFNRGVREMAESTGAVVLDLAAVPVAGDPRLWSADRLHANAMGHARIADGLCALLEVPGSDQAWMEPLPTLPRPRRHQVAAVELAWARRHLAPWIVRRARGISSGDGVVAKRWELAPLDGAGSAQAGPAAPDVGDVGAPRGERPGP